VVKLAALVEQGVLPSAGGTPGASFMSLINEARESGEEFEPLWMTLLITMGGALDNLIEIFQDKEDKSEAVLTMAQRETQKMQVQLTESLEKREREITALKKELETVRKEVQLSRTALENQEVLIKDLSVRNLDTRNLDVSAVKAAATIAVDKQAAGPPSSFLEAAKEGMATASWCPRSESPSGTRCAETCTGCCSARASYQPVQVTDGEGVSGGHCAS